MKKLFILNAGCVMGQVKKTVELFNASQSDIEAVSSPGGSVDCIRRMRKGEPCDLLILADDAIIAGMIMPEYTTGYQIFAGNSLGLVATKPENLITDDNWRQTLLNPETTFGHFDPCLDPGGYRAVMACLLADSVEPGLTQKLMNHPGRKVLKSKADERPDFMFSYMSGDKGGLPWARLPVSMNLSDPALNEHYATAAFDLDGDGKNIVRGSAICHALTIPKTAREPQPAKAFSKLFLQTDFAAAGFLTRNQIVGDWRPL